MDAKLVAGSAWNVPVKGALVNINEADVGSIVMAAGGLVKTLAIGGGLMIASGLLLKALSDCASSGMFSPKGPIGGMAKIWVKKRGNFYGFILDKKIECITLDDNKLIMPIDHITSINAWTYYPKKNLIYMVDGSWYYVRVATCSIRLLTTAGIQNVSIGGFKQPGWIKWLLGIKPAVAPYEITGVNSFDVALLRERLQLALNYDRAVIINTIGTDTFNKYFVQAS